jgi:hypothetical protein
MALAWYDEELLIRKLTKRYLPKESISFNLITEDQGGPDLQIMINRKLLTVTLGFDTKWKDLRRRIDKVLITSNNECQICEDFDSKVNNQQVLCCKCANTYCVYCQIDMLEKNRGLGICPYCRDTCGTVLSKEELSSRLNAYRTKWGLVTTK